MVWPGFADGNLAALEDILIGMCYMEENFKNGGEGTAGVLKAYSYFCTQGSLPVGLRVPEMETRSIMHYASVSTPGQSLWTKKEIL